MKIESKEHGLVLVPESEWEREQLRKLTQSSIESIHWEDQWNCTGNLVLTYRRHPFDC